MAVPPGRVVWPRVRLLTATVLLAAGGVLAQQNSAGTTVRYVANAGVLLTLPDGQALIDAPIREGIPPYLTSSAGDREQLEGARAPFDRVDAILITHWHEDHFSAGAVAAHLTANARAVLVSSPEVVARVRSAAPQLPQERTRAVLPAPGQSELVTVGKLPIRVLRIRHNPARRLPEQHVGFLVGDSPAILHTGDADPTADNFTVLEGLPRVDLALVPYWFLLSDTSRRLVFDSIVPGRIAGMHLPAAEAENAGRQLSAAGVRATLFVTPGAMVTVPARDH